MQFLFKKILYIKVSSVYENVYRRVSMALSSRFNGFFINKNKKTDNTDNLFASLNYKFKGNKVIEDCLFSGDAGRDNYSTPFEDEIAINHPINFISRYLNTNVILNAIESNPNIKAILSNSDLPEEFNLNNVHSIVMSHLYPTAKKAQIIYCNMGHGKNEINYIRLTQAALLHDIGKVFIPESILNKTGKLDKNERKIIELHNRLSYEILKTTRLHPMVAKLAYEHHDYENNLKKTQENQALMIADIYCALREKRPYKKPLNNLIAKTILYDIGAKGQIDSRYINCIN